MKLLTKSIAEQLLRNGRIRAALAEEGKAEADFIQVVKLFTPDAACTWLFTELHPEDPDIAFGLYDLGMGYPELGSVRISEIESVRGKLGLAVVSSGTRPRAARRASRRDSWRRRGRCFRSGRRAAIPRRGRRRSRRGRGSRG